MKQAKIQWMETLHYNWAAIVDDYVFPRLLASQLKHENKHWLWHLGITVFRIYIKSSSDISIKEEMQTFLHFECVHTYSVFWDTVHINNGQNEALGHCLRDIMSMRHNTLPEYEACLPRFPYFKFYRGSCRRFHTFQLSCKVKWEKIIKKKSRENLEKTDSKFLVSKFLSNILQM